MMLSTQFVTGMALSVLAAFFPTSQGPQGGGEPSWGYEFSSGQLTITVSTDALDVFEEVTEAACEFRVEGEERWYHLETPIRGRSESTQWFSDGLKGAEQVIGIRMDWVIDRVGLGAYGGDRREGSTPPSN